MVYYYIVLILLNMARRDSGMVSQKIVYKYDPSLIPLGPIPNEERKFIKRLYKTF